MSYMTPYYFTASAGDILNVWMWSNDFAAKVGLALSGSNVKLSEGSLNGWQYDSAYQGAALNYIVTTSSIFKVEATSVATAAVGTFKLYISAPQTASIVTNNVTTPWRLVYSPNGDKVFSTEWNQSTPGNSNVTVIDPPSNTIAYSYTYTDTVMLDSVYCSVNDSVFVWVSSSVGEFLDEYSSDGSSVLSSHPITVNWLAGGKYGMMAYNPNNNQILLVPSMNGGGTPMSWSVYDCSSDTIVHSDLFPSVAFYPVYVSSNDSYYVTSTDGNPHVKIDATSFVQTTVTNMTGSSNYANGLAYISEVDKLFFEGPSVSECIVFDPTTDSPVATIPGILDFENAVFDPCRNCIVIVDDAAGDPTYTDGGGLCYVSTGSYQPLNFFRLYGVYDLVYCNSTSTTFALTYMDNTIYSVFSTIPTGSLPQPAYPVSSAPTAWWSFEDVSTSGPWAEVVSNNPKYFYNQDPFSGDGTQTSVAGGIIGNTLQLVAESGPFSNNIDMTSSSVDMTYSTGITMTCWIKPIGSMPAAFGLYYLGYNGIVPPFAGVNTVTNVTAFWSANNWEIGLYSGSTPAPVITSSIPFTPSVGTWYFLRFSYDAIAGTLIYQIDNGPEQVSSGSFPYVPTTFVSSRIKLRIDGPGGTLDIDELGFYNRVLSTDEVSNLWNSGSGITYP